MTIKRLRPSFTFTEERLDELRAVVPEAFADGRVNWEALREALGEWTEPEAEGAEHFGLFWPGKREARRLAAKPSRGTLVPVAGEGVNEETTRNLFIEGDNLEVLKLLQKSYAGRVKMIYIDPPYNTGNDFVYKDDFRDPLGDYLRRTGQVDDAGEAVTTNTRADGRFHSNWLSMMYPRLRLARTLLADDGAICVSINDTEVSNLRLLMGEVFGDENFVAQIVWQRSKRGDSKLIATFHEYIIVFARNRSAVVEAGGWRRRKEGVDEVLEQHRGLLRELNGNHDAARDALRGWYRSLPKSDPRRAHEHYNWSDARGLYFASDFAGPDDGRKNRPRYDILHPKTGKPCAKPSTGWRWDEARTQAALAENPPRIHFGPDHTTIPNRKSYLAEIDSEPYPSVIYRDGRSATLQVEALVGKGVFPFPKNVEVLEELIQLMTKPGELVLDFFAGSATTGHAVLNVNRQSDGGRQFILVQLPEVTHEKSAARGAGFDTISQIALQRLRGAIGALDDDGEPTLTEDRGFRLLRLDPSSFRAWEDYDGDDVEQLEALFDEAETPLVKGWTTDSLVTEVLLLQGFPLDAQIDSQSALRKNDVRLVTSDHVGHRLWVCLDRRIHDATVAALALEAEDVFVCLDAALDDEAKLRLADQCTLETI
jgi:adenine-specific DNA-methyltransferase